MHQIFTSNSISPKAPGVPPLKIQVPTPCHASWHEMKGDERARLCSGCNKHVYNLSALSAAEASQLFHQKEGRLCVRFHHTPDGTLLHAKHGSAPFKSHLHRIKILAGTTLSLILATLGITPAHAGIEKDTPISITDKDSKVTMGIPIAVPSPIPTPTPIPQPSIPAKTPQK